MPVPARRPASSCGALFGDNGSGAAAFLLVQPSAALSTVSTAALCSDCWANRSNEEIEREATRALRPVLDGAAP